MYTLQHIYSQTCFKCHLIDAINTFLSSCSFSDNWVSVWVCVVCVCVCVCVCVWERERNTVMLNKAQSYLNATNSGGSICVSGLSVQEDTDCSTELLILVEVSVKVACRSTTATDWRHRVTSMLFISVEVSVKVACWSTTATDWRLVEVLVKVACQSTTATDCRHRWYVHTGINQ